MKLGVMQPYLFPYIGYFQLINAVDMFVIYDSSTFIKGGWVNRNRLKINGTVLFFTVPLVGASSNRSIRETEVAPEQYQHFRRKFFAMVNASYGKAPFYSETTGLLEAVFTAQPRRIADMARASIRVVCSYLGIQTRIVPTSPDYVDSSRDRAERIIQICRTENAESYINAIGGTELYSKAQFAEAGITLSFLKSGAIEYRQLGKGEFIPSLSIIDVLMNNSRETVREFLTRYELV